MKGETLGKHTRYIAYIIGVYLGDGSVCIKNSPHLDYMEFSLQVIDKDFAEYVAQVTSYLAKRDIYIKERIHKNMKNVVYEVKFHDYIFCEWLRSITNDKEKIPNSILVASDKVKKEFLRGLLDSEGYVALRKDIRPSKRTYTGWLCTIGLKTKSKWMEDVNHIFNEIGIKTKISSEKSKYGYDFYKIKPNFRDFVNSELYFTIWRKQQKINFYDAYLKSSETIRETLEFIQEDDIVRTMRKSHRDSRNESPPEMVIK